MKRLKGPAVPGQPLRPGEKNILLGAADAQACQMALPSLLDVLTAAWLTNVHRVMYTGTN